MMMMGNIGYERRLQAIERRLRELHIPALRYTPTTAWTPAFTGTSTAGTFTYTTQLGRYIRIEDRVFFSGRIVISAISVAPVGDMTITGLPIAASATADVYGGCYFFIISDFNYAANAVELGGYISPSASAINLVEAFDNSAAVNAPAANFTNASCNLNFRGDYLID